MVDQSESRQVGNQVKKEAMDTGGLEDQSNTTTLKKNNNTKIKLGYAIKDLYAMYANGKNDDGRDEPNKAEKVGAVAEEKVAKSSPVKEIAAKSKKAVGTTATKSPEVEVAKRNKDIADRAKEAERVKVTSAARAAPADSTAKEQLRKQDVKQVSKDPKQLNQEKPKEAATPEESAKVAKSKKS